MNQNEQENAFYANEDRREEPKEYFQLINDILKDENWFSLCDVGCATGDFLWYMRKVYGASRKMVGVDNYDVLRNIAQKRLSDCQFYKGDIWTGEGLPNEKYDIVCMSGVLYLFDRFERVIDNLLKITNTSGVLLIFGQFNSHSCHTDVHFKLNDREGRIVVYSIEEISKWLIERDYSFEFIPFKMKSKIMEKKDDPIRSYTIALADQTNGLINGLDLWIEQYLLKIKIK